MQRPSLALLLLLSLAIISCSRPTYDRVAEKPVVAEPAQEAQTRIQPVDVPPPAAETRRPAAAIKPRAAAAPRPADRSQANAVPPVFGSTTLPEPVFTPPSVEPARETATLPDVPKASPQPTTRQVTIPSGTAVALRMIDSVRSDDAHVGQTFRASMDDAITIDGETIVPSGARATVRLVDVQSAGKLKGQSELKLELASITVGNKSYLVESDTFYREGAAQGARTARSVGIGAAIGAITGGKKGAVIGAGTGAGSGAVIEAVRDEQIRIDSETRVDFHLTAPLDITLPVSGNSSEGPGSRSGPARLCDRFEVPSRSSSRDVNAQDVSGEWLFTLNDPRGRREGRLLFEQNGTTFRGTIIDNTTDGKLQGSVGGDSIRFTTDTEVRGRIVRMEYSGTINGDRMSGTATVASASGGTRADPPIRWSAARTQ